jgi:hypothetical protein
MRLTLRWPGLMSPEGGDTLVVTAVFSISLSVVAHG